MLSAVVALEAALAGICTVGLRGVRVYVDVHARYRDAAHVDRLVAPEVDTVELLQLFPSPPRRSTTAGSSIPPCAACCWTPGKVMSDVSGAAEAEDDGVVDCRCSCRCRLGCHELRLLLLMACCVCQFIEPGSH